MSDISTPSTPNIPSASGIPTAPTTPDEDAALRAEFDRICEVALDALGPDERRRVDEQLEKQNRRLCAKGDGAPSRARALTNGAMAVAVGMWQGLSPTEAAAAAGLDLKRDWAVVHVALMSDPRFRVAWEAARAGIGERLRIKAANVIETALDGGEVTRAAARLAPWVLAQGGASGHGREVGGAKTAAAQIVINLGCDTSDFAVVSDLLKDGRRGGVISG